MDVDGRTNGTVAKRNLSDVDINSHVGCELAVFFSLMATWRTGHRPTQSVTVLMRVASDDGN